MKIIKILFWILLISFVLNNYVYWGVIFCDKWDFSSENICSWWTQINTLSWIISFEWSYSNIDTWYIWTLNSELLEWNTEWYNKQWFFDIHKITKILNNTPEYQFNLGYLWNWINILLNWNIEWYNKQWFFDKNKVTRLLNNTPEYQFNLWYIASFEEESTKLRLNWKEIKSWLTYKEYYKEVFKILTIDESERLWYTDDEYNRFIENITDTFFYKKDYYFFYKINLDEHIIIKKNILESDLDVRLTKLLKNLKEINYFYGKTDFKYRFRFKLRDYILN